MGSWDEGSGLAIGVWERKGKGSAGSFWETSATYGEGHYLILLLRTG